MDRINYYGKNRTNDELFLRREQLKNLYMNETNDLQNEIMNNNIINMNEKNYYNIIPNDNYERLNEFKNNIGYGNFNFNNNNNSNYNNIQKINNNFNVAKTPEQKKQRDNFLRGFDISTNNYYKNFYNYNSGKYKEIYDFKHQNQ